MTTEFNCELKCKRSDFRISAISNHVTKIIAESSDDCSDTEISVKEELKQISAEQETGLQSHSKAEAVGLLEKQNQSRKLKGKKPRRWCTVLEWNFLVLRKTITVEQHQWVKTTVI